MASLTSTTTHNTAQPPSGTAASSAPAPAPLPDSVATELVHALAAVAVALAGT